MQQLINNNFVNEQNKIFEIVCNIEFFYLLYYLPNEIEKHNSNVSLLKYNNRNILFNEYLIKNIDSIELRDVVFFKKHIEIALKELHKANIFFYFNFNDLYLHRNSNMPILQNFNNSLLLNFEHENIEIILQRFSLPINNKCIPFSLFFFHFICFTLNNNSSNKSLKEVSIYELYDNNEKTFFGWNQDELKEVETIVKKGKTYEGMLNFYLQNKDIWYNWDMVILERSFCKYM